MMNNAVSRMIALMLCLLCLAPALAEELDDEELFSAMEWWEPEDEYYLNVPLPEKNDYSERGFELCAASDCADRQKQLLEALMAQDPEVFLCISEDGYSKEYINEDIRMNESYFKYFSQTFMCAFSGILFYGMDYDECRESVDFATEHGWPVWVFSSLDVDVCAEEFAALLSGEAWEASKEARGVTETEPEEALDPK